MKLHVRSIHFRLTSWYMLVLGISLLAFSVIVYFSLARALRRNTDNSIQSQAEWIAGVLGMLDEGLNFEEFSEDLTERISKRKGEYYIQIRYSSGEVLYQPGQLNHTLQASDEALQRALVNKYTLETIADQHEGIIRFVTLPVEDDGEIVYLVQVGASLKEIQQVLRQLLLVLLGSGIVALMASFFGGRFLAQRALKPVDDIINTARKIEAENLGQRLAVPPTEDELSRLVSTLNEMIGRLEHSFQQIRQFTADASHELRTPLTVIRGQTEVALRKERNAEEYREILSDNLEEIEWMSRLVENLLTLSRTDSGEIRLDTSPVHLEEILKDIYGDYVPIADAKHIKFLLDVSQKIIISGDEIQFRQMLLNLVDNAVKYTPEDGQIRLSLEKDGNFAKLQIEDTGIGISQEDLPHIFDRFFRVDKARSREMGGSGLGLSIVQWIVSAHKGHIEVTSKLGEGSCFTIRFPLESE